MLLLADETTGLLDSQTTTEVINIFSELNASGMTIIMVTDEPDVAPCTKRIVWFRDGQVIHCHVTLNDLHNAL